jgi:transposase InsO family protein
MQVILERQLVVTVLEHALRRRELQPGLLHHADRGSQYASAKYQQLLLEHAITPRMSRKGNCWDNAAIESFFATLKAKLPEVVFASHAAARSAVFDYIERFYNRQRQHSTLNYHSPAEHERLFLTSRTAA